MVLTLMFIARIAVLRMALRRNERRKQAFLSVWRALLTESALATIDPSRLPAISAQDVVFFLSYWNHLQNSLRGDTRERLNYLARTAGIDHAVRRMLKDGDNAERLLAIVSLVHLGDKTDTVVLKDLLVSEQPIACLHAARALLHIDPGALGELMPIIVERNDLPTAAVANILNEAGPDAISPLLADMLRNAFLQGAAAQYMVRLIALTAAAHPSVVYPSLCGIMDKTGDIEVLAACLKSVRTPAELPRIRQLIRHPDWRVRVHAVSALGDMGEKSDLELLKNLLSDSQWWVRYRAAQAISRLPFVTVDDLNEMRAHLDDNFAVDMLGQVVSERTS